MTTHWTDDSWREFARCWGVDPELFFPIYGRGTEGYDEQVTAAKSVCARCPVRAQCLESALERMPHGVAGGLDAYEREALRTARGRDAKLPTERVLNAS